MGGGPAARLRASCWAEAPPPGVGVLPALRKASTQPEWNGIFRAYSYFSVVHLFGLNPPSYDCVAAFTLKIIPTIACAVAKFSLPKVTTVLPPQRRPPMYADTDNGSRGEHVQYRDEPAGSVAPPPLPGRPPLVSSVARHRLGWRMCSLSAETAEKITGIFPASSNIPNSNALFLFSTAFFFPVYFSFSSFLP